MDGDFKSRKVTRKCYHIIQLADQKLELTLSTFKAIRK